MTMTMNTNAYCWGKPCIPCRVVDLLDDAVLIEANGKQAIISHSKIVGWAREGDRLQQLVTGGCWLWGAAQCTEDGLFFVGDGGQKWKVFDARWLKMQLSLFEALSDRSEDKVDKKVDKKVEMPQIVDTIHSQPPLFCQRHLLLTDLDDTDEEDLNVAIACGALPELKEGDRVRIALAGPPLEHLVGQFGEITGFFGISFVGMLAQVKLYDGSTKNFRPESLELLEPDKKGGTGE